MDSNIIMEVIDWPACIKLMGDKIDAAREILTAFIDELPAAKQELHQAYANSEFARLYEHAHRLHGSCCYVAVPQLKQAVLALESALKSNSTAEVKEAYNTVILAIDQIVTTYSANQASYQ